MTPRRILAAWVCLLTGSGVAFGQNVAAPRADQAAVTAPNDAAASAAATPSAPSPQLIKQARNAGFNPEVSKKGTLFCRTDASLGTRFTAKKCVDENGLLAILNQRLRTHDEMQRVSPCAVGCTAGH